MTHLLEFSACGAQKGDGEVVRRCGQHRGDQFVAVGVDRRGFDRYGAHVRRVHVQATEIVADLNALREKRERRLVVRLLLLRQEARGWPRFFVTRMNHNL